MKWAIVDRGEMGGREYYVFEKDNVFQALLLGDPLPECPKSKDEVYQWLRKKTGVLGDDNVR